MIKGPTFLKALPELLSQACVHGVQQAGHPVRPGPGICPEGCPACIPGLRQRILDRGLDGSLQGICAPLILHSIPVFYHLHS